MFIFHVMKILMYLVLALQATTASLVEVPSVVVAGVGHDIVFTCRTLDVVRMDWLINGTLLTNLQLSAIQTFDPIGNVGSVRFHSVPVKYNGTQVQCIANTTSSGIIMSQNATLLVQGLLSAPGSFGVVSENLTTVFLNWTAPFTLDISFVNQDITYCVDVVSSTSSATLHSECGITETKFTYPLPPRSWCHNFNFTVIPVNVVGNGTKECINFTLLLSTPSVISVTRLSRISESLTLSLFMSAPVCHIKMIFVTRNSHIVEEADLSTSDTTVIVSNEQLRDNRHYNVTVVASNIQGQTVANIEINVRCDFEERDCEFTSLLKNFDTYDIKATTILEENATIVLKTDYFEESQATGALYFITEESKRGVYLASNRNFSLDFTFPFSLSAGRYKLFLYDIESDGTLVSGVSYPAVDKEFFITDATKGQPFQPRYKSLEHCTSSTTGRNNIVVTCAYHTNSTISGFQMIAQQHNSSHLYVDKATNYQVTTSTQVKENGLYLVTIFPINGRRGIVDSDVEYMELVMVNDSSRTASMTCIGQEVGLGILALLSLVLTVMVMMLSCKVLSMSSWRSTMQLQSCPAEESNTTDSQVYEEIKDPGPHIKGVNSGSNEAYKVTPCSAYGVSLS